MRHTFAIPALLLASLSPLQAEDSPSPVANPERLPAFSWDRVPLYAHIRKDTAFTADEIKHLATFSLITFEKSTGNKDSDSTEAGTLKAARAVKAINPATKIGVPKGPAVLDGYTFTREFAHASVRLDIENETGEIVWKDAAIK